MPLAANVLEVVDRVVGNLEPIGATLTDIDGAALNLTGKTILFRMVLIVSPNTVVINNKSAALDVAASGQVSYSPTGTEMDTAGQYACYFIDGDTVDRLFPYDGANFQLNLMAETARAQP